MQCKQSQRVCEQIAKRLSYERPKTPTEFEKHEFMKDFISKTSKNNEETIALLDYMHGFLLEVATDCQVMIDGAILRDKLHMQSETINIMIQQREKYVDEIRSRH